MFDYPYIFEILSPKSTTNDPLDRLLDLFAERYTLALNLGCGISVPDNPMGQRRLSLIDCLKFRDLKVDADKVVMNLNTFHSKEDLDLMLDRAAKSGIRYLLVVRGDGGPGFAKLNPKDIGGTKSITTSVDLVAYINRQWPGTFITGGAFNPYKEQSFELPHFENKMKGGARFAITQPLTGRDPAVDTLRDLGLPVVIEAWMSNRIDLFYKSVGKKPDEQSDNYQPMDNLEGLHAAYPGCCVYLAMFKFNEDPTTLPRLQHSIR